LKKKRPRPKSNGHGDRKIIPNGNESQNHVVQAALSPPLNLL
jgi:hypothetical protein